MAPGARADLILLDADPLDRIEGTAAVARVVARGELQVNAPPEGPA